VGRRAPASSACSPFARNDVRKRHAIQAGEAARAVDLIDRSRQTRLTRALDAHRPTPLSPPSQGGERRGRARGIRATNSEGIQEPCNPNFAPPQGDAPSELAEAIAARPLGMSSPGESPCGSSNGNRGSHFALRNEGHSLSRGSKQSPAVVSHLVIPRNRHQPATYLRRNLGREEPHGAIDEARS
jgi:hypothetical protein